MKTLLLAIALLAAASAEAAEIKVQGIPCDGTTNGLKLIIERPPTAAEIAAEPPGIPGFAPPPLVMVYDHIACDGTAWALESAVKQRRGARL